MSSGIIQPTRSARRPNKDWRKFPISRNGSGGSAHTILDPPLFMERFENAAGYDLTGWTEFLNGGSVNEDYTLVVLNNSQSCLVANTGLGSTYFQRSVTATGQIFIFFRARLAASTGETISLLEVHDSISTILGGIYWDTNTEQIKVRAGASETTLSAGAQPNTTYNFWFEYNKDDGTNRIAKCGFSSSGTRPTTGSNYGEATAAQSATNLSIIAVGLMSSGFSSENILYYDNIIGNLTQIGDYPQNYVFLRETFDAVGFDNTGWTKGGVSGTADEDYTGVVLDGTQSLRIVTAGGGRDIRRSIPPIGNIFVFFKLRVVTPGTALKTLLQLDGSAAAQALLEYNGGTGVLRVSCGAANATTVGTLTVGTTYNVWFEYNKNNGTNRICNVGFSTGGVRPVSGNNFAQASTTSVATNVDTFYAGCVGGTFGGDVEFLFDYLLIDHNQIPDNP